MVQELNSDSFKEQLFDYTLGDDATLKLKKNGILEFYVPWCPHCQAMMPRYEKISHMFDSVSCYRINMEAYPDIAELFGVQSFPTFIYIFPNGDMQKSVGEMSVDDFADLIKSTF